MQPYSKAEPALDDDEVANICKHIEKTSILESEFLTLKGLVVTFLKDTQYVFSGSKEVKIILKGECLRDFDCNFTPLEDCQVLILREPDVERCVKGGFDRFLEQKINPLDLLQVRSVDCVGTITSFVIIPSIINVFFNSCHLSKKLKNLVRDHMVKFI